MDRYLYKAKRINNGEWVTGSLLTCEDGTCKIATSLLEVKTNGPILVCAYDVDRDTICQCTGLKDKNGKLIWENDIVKCLYNSYDENGVYIGKVIYREDTCCFVDANSESTDYEWWEEEKEVIGNIIDNAKLLESEK